jgi:hypothetical protein
VIFMDQLHRVRRSQAEPAMAGAPPFMLPQRGPATEGEREALRLPARRKIVRPPGRGLPGAANDGSR